MLINLWQLWQKHRHAAATWRGLGAMAAMRYGTKALSLVRLAVVARLLGPAPLGNYGLAFLAIAVAEVFTETGINIVLLKNPQKLSQYINVAWLISWLRGILIMIVLVAMAGGLANFYHSPPLFLLLVWASLIPFVRGAINPAIISYRQNLQFEREAALRTFLQTVDVLLGLGLTLLTHNVIGLIWGTLAAAVLEVSLSFLLFVQRPRLFPMPWSLVPTLYRETKYVIGSGILQYLSENLDNIMVGKLLGPAGLGIYQSAYKLASTLTIDLGSLLGQVLYPIFARMVHKKQSVTALVRSTQISLITIFLVMAIPLFGYTDTIVAWLLGSEWIVAVPTIRWLFLACALKSSLSIWNTLSILGENLKHYVVINGVMTGTMVLGIVLLTPRWGVTGAGMAVFGSVAIVFPYAILVLQKALARLPK